MSEAPKEIWCSTGLYYEYKKDWSEGEWSARPDFAAIKYVRADRIEELEAKLAKAVDALVQIVGKKYYADDPWGIANATLAELKGENDE
jgi:hypothetical protein